MDHPALVGIPVDFVLFGLTLLGVVLSHRKTLRIAAGGLAAIALYKLLFAPFGSGAGIEGLADHLVHEWVIVTNLFGLLVGFALLADQFESGELPEALPRYLPDG